MAAIVENPDQMAKFLEIKDQCPDLEHLIQIEGPTAPGVLAMDEVVDSGASGDAGDLFWQRAEKVKAEDVLTLIYTSGTTGNPKGVTLTHENLVSNVLAAFSSGARRPTRPRAGVPAPVPRLRAHVRLPLHVPCAQQGLLLGLPRR